MITEEALYYPYIKTQDDDFLKLALLYRDSLHYIIPPENIDILRHENQEINKFIKPCNPSFEEKELAIKNTVKILEKYKMKYGKYTFSRRKTLKSMMNKKGYNTNNLYEEFDTEDFIENGYEDMSFLFSGKYGQIIIPSLNMTFDEYCEKEGLGFRVKRNISDAYSSNGILVYDDICCIYMKELANVISKSRKIIKITDKVNLFEEILDSNLSNSNICDINEFKIMPVIYENMMPSKDKLRKVSTEEIIQLRSTESFNENIPKLRKFMNEYIHEISSNYTLLGKNIDNIDISFDEFLKEKGGRNFKSDVNKICTIRGIELLQNASNLVNILSIYPILAPTIEKEVTKEIKNTLKKSCKELILSNNTESLLKSYECIIDIENIINKDNTISYKKELLTRFNKLLYRRINK